MRANLQLPPSLQAWRLPGSEVAEESIWKNLHKVFQEAGFTLWPRLGSNVQTVPDGTNPSVTGFGFFRSDPRIEVDGVAELRVFRHMVCNLIFHRR